MKTKLTFKQSILAGIMAAGAAVVVNAILFFAFHAAGIITDDIMVQPNMPMTIVPIIMSSLIPTLIASIVFFLLERFTNNGFNIFRIVAIVLLLVSLVNPFLGIVGVTMGYAIVLDVMHVVVVAALLYFIGKAVKQKV